MSSKLFDFGDGKRGRTDGRTDRHVLPIILYFFLNTNNAWKALFDLEKAFVLDFLSPIQASIFMPYSILFEVYTSRNIR